MKQHRILNWTLYLTLNFEFPMSKAFSQETNFVISLILTFVICLSKCLIICAQYVSRLFKCWYWKCTKYCIKGISQILSKFKLSWDFSTNVIWFFTYFDLLYLHFTARMAYPLKRLFLCLYYWVLEFYEFNLTAFH